MAERLKWTPEMLERLHELRARNWTVLEIAQDMGIPFELVQGRINREKIKEKNGEPIVDEPKEPQTGDLLTVEEAFSLAELIDLRLFDIIRQDEELDNIRWLRNIVFAYEKLRRYSGYPRDPACGEEEQNAE